MARSKHASLYDFRDLDLMLTIADAPDGITAMELAEEIGLGEDGTRAAGTRLAWMRRYGMVEHVGHDRLWRLSRSGERVAEAKLKAAATRQLVAVPDEALVDVMAHVTARYRLGDPMTANLLRREFLYGTHNGRRRS